MTGISLSIVGAMLTPALFYAGAAAVAIPVLIHLLSKRRFRRIRWAATDFLLEANRQNRRRIRLQELILLGMRCLTMLLIGLLLARIFLRPEALATILGSRAATDRIVLLDDSFSMQLHLRGETGSLRSGTVFDRAKAALNRLVVWLHDESPDDTVTILLTSQPNRPLQTQVVVGQMDLRAFEQQLEILQPSSRGADMPAAITALGKLLNARRSTTGVTVYMISDFQRRDWSSRIALGANHTADQPTPENAPKNTGSINSQGPLAALAGGGRNHIDLEIVLVDAGLSETDNLAVTAIESRQPQVVAGVSSPFTVRARNFGRNESKPTAMQVYIGETHRPDPVVPAIPAGQSAQINFEATFNHPGTESLTVVLGTDALPADNTRTCAVPVLQATRILIVDGEPSVDPYEDEAFLPAVALRPEGPQFSGNEVTIIEEHELESTDLSSFHVVILANVSQVTVDTAERIREYVFDGGGLAIFLGDQVQTDTYNQVLWAEGSGVLPGRLGDVVTSPAGLADLGVGDMDVHHPVMQTFNATDINHFADTRVWQLISCIPDVVEAPVDSNALAVSNVNSEPGNDSAKKPHPARVLLSANDAEHTPLIVERACGRGQTWLVTTSIDKEWDNLADQPVFVVLLLEMVQHLSKRDDRDREQTVGEPIHLQLDPARHAPEAVVQTPGYPEQPSTVIHAQPDSRTGLPAVTWQETAQPGIYRFELKDKTGMTQTEQIAVNLDPSESNLGRVSRDQLLASSPDLPVRFVNASNLISESDTATRREMWPPLLILLVITLMAEQMLAWWFGGGRPAARTPRTETPNTSRRAGATMSRQVDTRS